MLSCCIVLSILCCRPLATWRHLLGDLTVSVQAHQKTLAFHSLKAAFARGGQPTEAATTSPQSEYCPNPNILCRLACRDVAATRITRCRNTCALRMCSLCQARASRPKKEAVSESLPRLCVFLSFAWPRDQVMETTEHKSSEPCDAVSQHPSCNWHIASYSSPDEASSLPRDVCVHPTRLAEAAASSCCYVSPCPSWRTSLVCDLVVPQNCTTTRSKVLGAWPSPEHTSHANC